MSLLEYEGCNFLRQRLLLSTLSGVPIKITNIRCRGENPGMLDYEVELLQLLEKMTNGSKTNISVTGTAFVYRPGKSIDVKCYFKGMSMKLKQGR